MSSKALIPVVHKTLFRADFTASLAYLSLFGNAAEEVRKTGYSKFEVDGCRISMFDSVKRRSATIDAGAILYVQDSSDDSVELQSIDDVISNWQKALNITVYNRLGLRKWIIIPTAIPFEQLVALVNSRATRMEEIAAFMPKIDDSYLRFDCSEGSYRFHFKIGPVRKAEMFRTVEFSTQHLNPESQSKDAQKIIDSYPETGVFMDIDFFQFDGIIRAEEINTFLIAGRQRITEIAKQWADFLFNTETEI